MQLNHAEMIRNSSNNSICIAQESPKIEVWFVCNLDLKTADLVRLYFYVPCMLGLVLVLLVKLQVPAVFH